MKALGIFFWIVGTFTAITSAILASKTEPVDSFLTVIALAISSILCWIFGTFVFNLKPSIKSVSPEKSNIKDKNSDSEDGVKRIVLD